MNISKPYKKRLLELAGITKDRIKEIVWKANDWDDCVRAVQMQYGNIVPLFHATTTENALIIDKEGLKLTEGGNRKHIGYQENIYFQIGKSDYLSGERSVLYRYDAPIEFILKYCYADTDSINYSEEEVSEIIGRDITDRSEVLSSETEEFIHAFVSNGNKLLGLELIALENDGFPTIIPVKVKG
jgi:hypothetical protein